jgi:putative addiction module component (TIGR02574 family)
MAASTETLLRQALELTANDRAALIEGLITSLDKPDPAIDALWLKEAESRMAAYRLGELEAVDADQVFAEPGKQS